MEPIAHLNLEDPLGDARRFALETMSHHPYGFSLPQPFYNDERLFQLDMQTIFEREWIFAGMSCEIPAKGNFITLDIGHNPVVIVRGDGDAIHAFHNTCHHRGSRLCSTEKGKLAKLVCPYHQWTYELDGRLLFAGTEMGEDFQLEDYGLAPVALTEAGGYLFVSLAENPPDVSDLKAIFDSYLSFYDMANLKVAVTTTIEEQANWKLVLENNRECYHCNGSHPELIKSLYEFDDTEDPRATPEYRSLVARKQQEWDGLGIPWKMSWAGGKRNRLTRTPLVEGTVSMTMDGRAACRRPLTHQGIEDMGSLRILHLPNSWNHFVGDHAAVFRVLPLGPQRTQVTTKWLVHKDAVEGVDYDVENLSRVWDATNAQDRRLAEENQRGINSLAYRPGPYSPTYEYGVIDFIDWYRTTLAANLGSSPALSLASG
ncbi:aromatic ring-hydroxylating dioxygenase subunit alpha [Halomonas litopenaei]|nr:aromatic ring-hydroxylating dioxygenase subunit alpha [Halomonas litopenaei]